MRQCRASDNCRQLIYDELLNIFLIELYSMEEHQKPRRLVLSWSDECATRCKLVVLESEIGGE